MDGARGGDGSGSDASYSEPRERVEFAGALNLDGDEEKEGKRGKAGRVDDES